MSEKCTKYKKISKTEIQFLSFISEYHTSHNNSEQFLNKNIFVKAFG